MKYVSLAFIANPKGEWLLQYRDSRAPEAPSRWTLFGGHQEGNETPLETVAREVEEEISLRLLPERFVFLDTVRYPDVEVSLYRAFLKEGEEEKIKLREGADYQFFGSKEEILKLHSAPRVREIFRKYLK